MHQIFKSYCLRYIQNRIHASSACSFVRDWFFQQSNGQVVRMARTAGVEGMAAVQIELDQGGLSRG